MILKVGNKKIERFNSVDVVLKYDSVASTFAFSFYYDPANGDIAALAKPGEYPDAVIEHNGEVLITGKILSHTYQDGAVKSLTSVGGYSKPGVLEDCEIPVSLYPLQSDGKTFTQIAQRLIKPFGLTMVVDADVSARANAVYQVATAEATGTVKAYLASLAAQKNMILSHSPSGQLLCTKAKAKGKSVASFENGQPNTEISLSFDGQSMHSEITVMKQAAIDGGNAGQSTVVNPFVAGFRPTVKIQTSGTDNDTQLAAKNMLAAELKGIKVTIVLSGPESWLLNGLVLRPNILVDVTAPQVYLPRRTQFFVEQVALSEDANGQRAVLTCVLPEVHNGETPKNIFA